MKKILRVEGMSCVVCAGAVEKAVKSIGVGIKTATVNLSTHRLRVDYDENAVELESIFRAIEKAGFKVFDDLGIKTGSEIELETKLLFRRVIFSLLFLLPLLYISMGAMVGLPLPQFLEPKFAALNFAIVQLLLTLPIIFLGKNFYLTGMRSLVNKNPNMDSLIAIGTGAALLYSLFASYQILRGEYHFAHNLYFESAAVILTLITLGKYLESLAKGRTSEAIKKLIALAPQKATVIRLEQEYIVDVSEVCVDEIVLLKPGEKVPVDGIIIWGNTFVDESMLTGESIPVAKAVGDNLIGGSLNKNGVVKIRVSKIGEDTVLSQIIALVENAQASKAPMARFADVIASYFVPTVIMLAIITAVFWYWRGENETFVFTSFISVLVIACPCALGLATPTSIMVGTGKAAEFGILFKNGLALETTQHVDIVVLDKTGTITQGRPEVTDIMACEDFQEDHVLLLAASAERCSEHPLAEAIQTKAKEKFQQLMPVTSFKTIEGRGLEVYISEQKVIVGNAKLLLEQKVALNSLLAVADKFSKQGKTVLFIAIDDYLAGIIAVADPIKPSSVEAVRLLSAMSIDTVMLTGDNKDTATAVAKQVGIKDIYAEVLPADKVKIVENLQSKGRKVAMVGDGINDAPALVQANIGMAVAAGTDIAVEAADIVLMKNDLRDIALALQISKLTVQNIKQNLFWAFAYNVICIPIAMGVLHLYGGPLLNPMIAGAAMSLSSVSVVTNSLRIKNFKYKK